MNTFTTCQTGTKTSVLFLLVIFLIMITDGMNDLFAINRPLHFRGTYAENTMVWGGGGWLLVKKIESLLGKNKERP